MYYLFITEDGSITRAPEYFDDDAQSCDDGVLSIIDIHSIPPTEYHQGAWVEIPLQDRFKPDDPEL